MITSEREYVCLTEVYGEYNPSNNYVYIRTDRVVECQSLTNGLRWIHPAIYLKIYTDPDCEGYYIMFGQTDTQLHEDEYFSIGNCPSY